MMLRLAWALEFRFRKWRIMFMNRIRLPPTASFPAASKFSEKNSSTAVRSSVDQSPSI